MNRKSITLALTGLLACASLIQGATAQTLQPQGITAPEARRGQGFIYHGTLLKAGQRTSALCDMRFGLFDAVVGGNLLGNTLEQQVQVKDGQFAAKLDFGAALTGSDDVYLDLWVRCPTGEGTPTHLQPRQPLLPVPSAFTLRPGARIRSQDAEAALTIEQVISVTAPVGNQAEAMRTTGSLDVDTSFQSTQDLHCSLLDCAAVIGKSNYIGVLGVHTTTTSTEAGVKGQTLSTAPGAVGVLGEIDDGVSSPGSKAAGVKGWVHAGDLGIGVFGLHEGGGKGVRGESNSGVGVYAQSGGSTNDNAALVAENTNQSTAGGNAIYAKNNSNSPTIVAENKGGGSIFVALGSNGNTTFAVRNDGTVSAPVIEITGGSDFAERFTTSPDIGKVEPGMLMVIDEANPGHLKISQGAYDSKVAGIVSGAGGVNPGMTLRQDQVLDGDAVVAIAGRVYVRAEALTMPINPGDLLTTSQLKGYAMKASDRTRMSGAVIGKAMTGLNNGTGLVLVLVNLQ